MAAGQSFGDFLLSERERRRLTQRQLADQIGISSDKTIKSWEEDRSRPQADNLAELGRVFGWDFNRVMTHLGAPALRGVERVATGISRRPLLLQLFEAATHLDDAPLSNVVTMVTALKREKDHLDESRQDRDDN